jgi:hypothetical protein
LDATDGRRAPDRRRPSGRRAVDKRGRKRRREKEGRQKIRGEGGRLSFLFLLFLRHSNGVGPPIQPDHSELPPSKNTRRTKDETTPGHWNGANLERKAGGGELALSPGALHVCDASDAPKVSLAVPTDPPDHVAGIASDKGNTRTRGPGGGFDVRPWPWPCTPGNAMSVDKSSAMHAATKAWPGEVLIIRANRSARSQKLRRC